MSKVSHMAIWPKSTAGRGNSDCKGSHKGAYLAYLSKSKEASVAEFRREEGKAIGDKVEKIKLGK